MNPNDQTTQKVSQDTPSRNEETGSQSVLIVESPQSTSLIAKRVLRSLNQKSRRPTMPENEDSLLKLEVPKVIPYPIKQLLNGRKHRYPLIRHCICGFTGFRRLLVNDIPLHQCDNCKIVHQIINQSTKEYLKFFQTQFSHKFQLDRGEESKFFRFFADREEGTKRITRYLDEEVLGDGFKVLDVGSGNGGFVVALRESGYEADGIELDSSMARTYQAIPVDFNKYVFPKDSYNLITFHDSLQRMLYPGKVLQKCAIISRGNSFLVIDFPNFFEPEGKKYWTRKDQIWFLSESQMMQVIQTSGYRVEEVKKSQEKDRLVFYCVREWNLPPEIPTLQVLEDKE